MEKPKPSDRARDIREIISSLEKSLEMAREQGLPEVVSYLEMALAEAHDRARDAEPDEPGTDLGITKEPDA